MSPIQSHALTSILSAAVAVLAVGTGTCCSPAAQQQIAGYEAKAAKGAKIASDVCARVSDVLPLAEAYAKSSGDPKAAEYAANIRAVCGTVVELAPAVAALAPEGGPLDAAPSE